MGRGGKQNLGFSLPQPDFWRSTFCTLCPKSLIHFHILSIPWKLEKISWTHSTVPDGFSGQLPGGERTGLGQVALRLPLHQAVLLPGLEVAQQLGRGGVPHPLQNLNQTKHYYLLHFVPLPVYIFFKIIIGFFYPLYPLSILCITSLKNTIYKIS